MDFPRWRPAPARSARMSPFCALRGAIPSCPSPVCSPCATTSAGLSAVSTPPACSSVTAPTMPGTRRATWFWAPCTFPGKFLTATWIVAWKTMNAPSWRKSSGGASRNGFRRPTCWAKPGSAGFHSASTNACWCRARLSPNLSNSASRPGCRPSRRESSTSAPVPAASASPAPMRSSRRRWCSPTCPSMRWRWPTSISSATTSASGSTPSRATVSPGFPASAST